MAEKTRSRRRPATAARAADSRGEGRLFLGTSGFAYAEWKGGFYPKTLRAKDMLAFYAGRFSSVEINYTFRSLPSEKALTTWRDAAPESFVFAIKAHQSITHRRRLAGAEAEVKAFLDALAPLGDRTGPILFQCPDRMAFDRARLEEFLPLLPARHRYAFEFRDASWAEARPLIEAHGMAWCIAETDEFSAADEALTAGTFHFLRLRKTEYTAAEISSWARRIGAALRAGRDVHCYFRHEDEGRGPRFAAALENALVAGRRRRARGG